MKEYILKPSITPVTVVPTLTADKPGVARPVPPRQPLPRPVWDPARPSLKLGLDVHLECLMAVAQRDHASPLARRQFSRAQLIAAGAQSFLITPIALNGKRKTDKLDARALCLRLSR